VIVDYYRISPALGAKLSSRHLTPPSDAIVLKNGMKRWTEEITVDDVEFTKDEGEGKENLRVGFRVKAGSGGLNDGRQFSEFFNFYWNAVETGKPENRAQQTTISYQSFSAMCKAFGMDGYPSPGELRSVDVQGLSVVVDVNVGPDKDGTPRQRLSNWRAS
jgi:hypothetical protein